MKKLNQFICLSLVFQLVYGPVASADNGKAANIIQKGIGAFEDILGTVQQNKAERQEQKLINQYYNNLNFQLSTKPYPNDIFPGTKDSPGCTNIDAKLPNISSENLCPAELAPPDANGVAEYEAFMQMAFKLYDEYDRWTRDGSDMDNLTSSQAGDSRVNKLQANEGKICLNNRKKETIRFLEKQIESIDDLIDKIHQETIDFKEEFAQKKSQIQELQGFLDGGKGSQLNNKTRLYSEFFKDVINNNQCSGIMSPETIQENVKQGLRGLLGSVDDIRIQDGKNIARELITNSPSIESDIYQMADLAKKRVEKLGIEKVIEEGSIRGISSYGLDQSPGFLSSSKREINNIQEDIVSLEKEANSLGVNQISGIFKFGETNFDQKIALFKKEQEDLCVKTRFGFTSNNDAIWEQKLESRLKDSGRGKGKKSSSSTNLKWFKQALSSVLTRDDLTPSQKLQKVKEIESRTDKDLKFVNSTTSEGTVAANSFIKFSSAYADHLAQCKTELKQTTSLYSSGAKSINRTDQSEGFSVTDIISRAEKLHKKFKAIESQAAQNIYSSIVNKMLNCSEDQSKSVNYSSSPSTCSASKVDPKGENFCLNQSIQCAQTMESCAAKVNNSIEKIQIDMQSRADQMNNLAKKYAEDQKQRVDKVKKAYKEMYTGLKKQFKYEGAIELPEKFNIEIPLETLAGDLDVALVDPEKMTQTMDQKLTELKTAMTNQNTAIKTSIDAEIKKWADPTSGLWAKERDRWKKERDLCEKMITAYDKSLQDLKDAKKSENDELASMCAKISFQAMAPGCSGDKGGNDAASLTDTYAEIAKKAGFDKAFETQLAVGDYRRKVCAGFSAIPVEDDGANEPSSTMREDFCDKLSDEHELKGSCNDFLSEELDAIQKNKAISNIDNAIKKQTTDKQSNDNNTSFAEAVEQAGRPIIPFCESINSRSTASIEGEYDLGEGVGEFLKAVIGEQI